MRENNWLQIRDQMFDTFFHEHGIPLERLQDIERAAWTFLPGNPRPSITEFLAAMDEFLKAQVKPVA